MQIATSNTNCTFHIINAIPKNNCSNDSQQYVFKCLFFCFGFYKFSLTISLFCTHHTTRANCIQYAFELRRAPHAYSLDIQISLSLFNTRTHTYALSCFMICLIAVMSDIILLYSSISSCIRYCQIPRQNDSATFQPEHL